ncbi:ribonuclease J [Paenibacillus agaridevorans]|uniref:ribonuclease J n=1 Tax=Paenibacillus agaridevorans TaxID=171404 RepID=UPI002484B1A9|nr:ribonuclease J [Paenibacillus agaridevorans]
MEKPYSTIMRRKRKTVHSVQIFALGGFGEIGKNMYGIQYRDEIVVIDCGLKFPDTQLPGIDYIIPDFRYLIANKDKVKGLFLTHGHEDHIGGIPYLLKEIDIPIYGAALTIGLLRHKLEEHGLLSKANLHIIDGTTLISYRHLSVEFFRTSHSIPDSFGIAVQTPYGYVVQTGDFKFDHTPIIGSPPAIHQIAAIGEKGVLALLSDSTNSERTGITLSEQFVGEAILKLFETCKGRILFATFASNVHRLQTVVEAAISTNRKLVVLGRSMEKVFNVGQELGYIRVPKGMIIDPKEMIRYRPDQTVVVCTGSQGEPQAALTRIASGSHRWVQVQSGDTVIFSSSPIPGNIISVNRSIDLLMRAGADVVYGSKTDVHTSGHGSQEDLKLMLNLIQPQYFVPIHGEYRMMLQHGKLAAQTGVSEPNIFLMELGDVLRLTPWENHLDTKIPSGESFVRDNQVLGLSRNIFQNRLKMGTSGIVIVLLVVRKDPFRLLTGPTIISRGFVYMRDSVSFMNQTEDALKYVLSKKQKSDPQTWSKLIIENLEEIFIKEIGRSPYILPIINEL